MTRIFIHVEAPLNVSSRPYRLSACTADRSCVFEANITWEGDKGLSDELSRRLKVGTGSYSSDGKNVECYGSKEFVADSFHSWLGDRGKDVEFWTLNMQGCWRELNALGLHVLPICDLSTFVRVLGMDWIVENGVAYKDALIKCGGGSARLGCYKQSFLFSNVHSKSSIFK